MATTPQMSEAVFLGKTGNTVKVKDIITSDDCWATKEGNLILSHKAVQKIAAAGGISKTYDVHESDIHPDYKNGLEHIVRVTIKCNAKTEVKGACVHDDENTLTVTGEANRENTSNRGKGYLRKMAEKRAYDIAILEHLGLYSTLFSEDESESFSKEPREQQEGAVILMNTDLEATKTEVNVILKAKTDDELAAAWKEVDTKHKATPFSRAQMHFLADVYDKQAALIAAKKKA